MKKLEDYLHFYFGQQLFIKFGDNSSGFAEVNTYYLGADARENMTECKLVLRPLSDMSEAEAREFLLDVMHFANAFGIYPFNYKIDKGFLSFQGMGGNYSVVIKNWGKEGDGEWLFNCTYSMNDVVWLLKRGFDIFGLISENLGLDKTKIKQLEK